MLLAYDKTSGKVLWNSGTNSAYPSGPPDAVAYQATNSNAGLFRLNDNADADLVALVFTNEVSVKNGQLVIGATNYTPKPPGEGGAPTTPPLPLDQELASIRAQIDELTALVMLGGFQ